MTEKRGGPNRGQGRKPISETEPTVTMCLRMTLSQREKLARLGGAEWVRDRIYRAKEPKASENGMIGKELRELLEKAERLGIKVELDLLTSTATAIWANPNFKHITKIERISKSFGYSDHDADQAVKYVITRAAAAIDRANSRQKTSAADQIYRAKEPKETE